MCQNWLLDRLPWLIVQMGLKTFKNWPIPCGLAVCLDVWGAISRCSDASRVLRICFSDSLVGGAVVASVCEAAKVISPSEENPWSNSGRHPWHLAARHLLKQVITVWHLDAADPAQFYCLTLRIPRRRKNTWIECTERGASERRQWPLPIAWAGRCWALFTW
jgi:hypothetical protein